MSEHDINNIPVAPNFLLREFECKDGSHQVVLHRELLERLQALRDALERPVIINSGSSISAVLSQLKEGKKAAKKLAVSFTLIQA